MVWPTNLGDKHESGRSAAALHTLDTSNPASDDWHQATGLLGHELKRGGHYAEALQMVELFLARERIAQMTLLATDIAISQKNFRLAEKYLAESKSILEGWSKSERGEDREDAQRLQPHFEEIQAKLKAALAPNQNPTLQRGPNHNPTR